MQLEKLVESSNSLRSASVMAQWLDWVRVAQRFVNDLEKFKLHGKLVEGSLLSKLGEDFLY
jgi:hypothetical protein